MADHADQAMVALDGSPPGAGPSPTPTGWEPAGSVALADGVLDLGPMELSVTTSSLGGGRRMDLVLRNPGRPGAAPLGLDRLRLRLPWRPRRVLEHGWQSWSDVGPRSVGDRRPLRRLAPRWVRATYQAQPDLAGRVVSGDQFLLCAQGCGPDATTPGDGGGIVGFLDGRRHLSTVVATGHELVVVAHLDGLIVEPGQQWALDPLWSAGGDPGQSYRQYIEHWAAEAGARPHGPSPLGWCSWYQYFWKVTPGQVRANLALAAAHGIGLCQLDDGYQRAVGDWLEPNDRFTAPGDRPADLAAAITDAGLQPGIWTAPFVAGARSTLAASHPDWLARTPARTGRAATGGGRSRPLRAMYNPQAWGGWAYALDTTHPAVLDHLRRTFAALVDQGWSYHKIDFCYAAAVPGRRHGDGRLTRAQALVAGLEAVRDGIGPQSVLLGCGIPLAQSVGLVDALRVSPDTAARWASGLAHIPGYPDTAPAARNAIGPSIYRAPMHRRLWVNDPDCLLLRPSGTRLSPTQRAVLASMVTGTGGFTLLSDDLATYGPEQWSQVDRLAALHGAADTSLELDDPFAAVPRVTGAGGLSLQTAWAEHPGGAGGAAGARTVLAQAGTPGTVPWARLSGPAE